MRRPHRSLAMFARPAVALAAGSVLAWAVSSCGSGSAATTLSQKAHQAAATASTKAEAKLAAATVTAPTTSTRTVQQPPKTTTVKQTKTVTQPARTATVTRTQTAPAPTPTVSHHTATVQVTPTSTTGGESSGGVPWWGWLLIALGAAGVVMGVIALRRGRTDASATPDDTAPAAPGEPPDSDVDQP